MGEERRAAEDFVRELSAVFGADLVAAALYGSAARGEYREGVSDLNLLVIVRDLGIENLRAAAGPVRGWTERGNSPPMMFSDAEWRSSADVFPIEYSEIRESHVTLAGDLAFGEISLHAGQLRLQLEHELRSAKIQFREGILANAAAPDRLGRLLLLTVPTFLSHFRAALRLAGESVPAVADTVVEAIAVRAGFDPEPVLAVVRQRGSGAPARSMTVDDPLIAGYLQAIERVTAWVDELALATPDGEEI